MELIKKVESLIADVDKTHRYSMSRIYGIYNEVFSTQEVPQSCASCLIRKVKELREWYNKSHRQEQTIAEKPQSPKKRKRKPSL